MTSNYINSLLTDKYQLTMAYGYWKTGIHESNSTFEMFFRKNPFKGEFTVFGGLFEVMEFLKTYQFTEQQLKDLKDTFNFDDAFLEYLSKLDCSKVTIDSVLDGQFVFPRCPVMIIRGPLIICQLLETTLLNLCNYASLVSTNACRMKLRQPTKQMVEFGLRRAQGPDGGMTASKYSYIGGFDGTSNVQAGIANNIPIVGTHAHSFVEAFRSLEQVRHLELNGVNFTDLVLKYINDYEWNTTNKSELTAFISYAYAFPTGFMALIDTYDTLNSGVYNFMAVALALKELGYKAIGVRLDSGDLAYISKKVRVKFEDIASQIGHPDFGKMCIVASNDIDEEVLMSLITQGHEIDMYGIGTNLVTCKKQPALGMVYKLVSLDDIPRIKLSDQTEKITFPGNKKTFRLHLKNKGHGKEFVPFVDVMIKSDEEDINIGDKFLCRDPFDKSKRMYVTPSLVEKIHERVWDGTAQDFDFSLGASRERCLNNMHNFRPDHIRYLNPTPYKVSLSCELHDQMMSLWESEKPIIELS